MLTTREELHRLIDALPAKELPAARRLLENLQKGADPVLQALENAPEDDEPETPEGAEAVRVAMEEIAQGKTVAWEEARRRLSGNA